MYKTFNDQTQSDEWVHLNFEQLVNSRQTTFMINRNNKLNVGMNALACRFYALNNKIPLEWLNETYLKFKLKCKNKFLSF